MTTTLSPSREDKIADYIRLSAVEMFLIRLEAFLPAAVKDEVDIASSHVLTEELGQLLNELWPNDEDVEGEEYRRASEKERLVVISFLTHFGQMTNDYLLRDIEELATARGAVSDA